MDVSEEKRNPEFLGQKKLVRCQIVRLVGTKLRQAEVDLNPKSSFRYLSPKLEGTNQVQEKTVDREEVWMREWGW
jgi:hypothetical protein